jgi:TP901 family phage tail tape measure protein
MAQQKLGIEITGNAAGLTAALNTASGKLKAFGSKMQSVGGGLSRSLTLPLVAAGVASVKMAFDFDKSMTQIKALVGVAGDEVDAMGQRAKQMALDTGKSATEAGDALFYITSAGLRGEEAMQVLEASLKAAAVGLGETKTIADLATSAMNAYGRDTLSASQATDILATAVREGKLEASALAGSMGGVIPIASNLGVGFEEVAAALAAMSRTGTDAANGATQLNAILSSIAKPTDQSVLAFQRMGLTTDGLSKSLADDGLLNTLVLLKNRLEASGQSFTDIVPNVRAWKGVLDLTGAGLNDNIKIFEALNNTMGATDQMFKTTSESAQFKFTKATNEMKGSLLEVGLVLLEMLVPVVTKLGTFLREASDAFNSLDEGTKKVILTFGGIVAVVGPALLVIGKISTTLGFLSASLPLLTTNWKLFSAALMANPIIAVATAVLALGVAIYSYTQAQKDALAEVNTIEEVESALAKKRIKFLEEQQILSNSVNTNKQYWAKKNMDALSDEIKALEDKKRALDDIRIAQEKAAAAEPTLTPETPTPTGGTGVAVMATIAEGLQAFGATTLIDPTTALTGSIITNAEKMKYAVGGFVEKLEKLQETAMLVGAEVSNAILGMSGSLIDSLGLAENGMQGFLGGLLKMAAQAISAFLGQAIAAAIAGANIAASFTAAAAIFTQPAFMATMVGGVLAAFAAIPKFADGGIVSGPTMGLMGEYPGARSNPEVIAPLNKLESMLGGRGATNVNVGGEFVMRGSDLVVVLDRANKNRNRLI